MNKVYINCQKENNAKFYYASRKMAFESKAIKMTTFLVSLVPIILSLIPMGEKKTLVFAATMVSFALTIILELLSTFLTTHKEQSVLLEQLYRAGITDTTFSKTEYDREMTNSLNELAIRKAETKISSLKEFNTVYVPKEIDDKYSYFYISRVNAASNNFLMSRMYAVYLFALALISALFISFAFVKHNTFEFLQLIIQFYPLVLPVIKNINACHKAMKYYTKISADIDNYFADGNRSPEKRARFVYYLQNLDFEAMMESPAKYTLFSKLFSGGLRKLSRGVTNRFIEEFEKLEGKKIAKIEPTPLKPTKEKKVETKNTEKIAVKPKTVAKTPAKKRPNADVKKAAKTSNKKTAENKNLQTASKNTTKSKTKRA